jgi:hypothetical protein
LLTAVLWTTSPAAGQAPGAGPASAVPGPTIAGCEDKRTVLAVAQSLGLNLAANRVNVWVFDWQWARVDFDSWSRNLRLGWDWDETQFGVNMFLHPYHGSLYFDAARANCLSFWEAVPITFLGSWTWEFLAERARPSLNDFAMTGFGGAAMGEILHRISAVILDEEATGGERIARELAALVVTPMGGANRLVRGQWTERGVNPVDRVPESYLVRLNMGGRRVRESGSARGPSSSPTLLLDVELGDVFDTEYRAPFDVINLLAQVSPDGGGVNVLRATGRLYGRELTARDSWHRHQLVVNQRFDYVNNPVYHFGEQSLEAGLHSLWRIGPSGLHLSTRLAGGAVMLGAIDALDADAGGRVIDYGPGLGAIAEASLEQNGTTYISFYNRFRHLRAVSGARADHTMLFTGFDVTIPITSQFGIGAYVSRDWRRSYYAELPNHQRSYRETRVYVTWTPARRTLGQPR